MGPGRRKGFWAAVEVGLCDGREGWKWMARGGMMTCYLLICLMLITLSYAICHLMWVAFWARESDPRSGRR